MTVSRRSFLRRSTAAGAGLVISFHVPTWLRAAPQPPQPPQQLPPANAFLRIGPDDSVTVVLAHSEMGQGIWTGLAMLIAEELDCDWSKVRSEHAPAAPVYAGKFGIMLTGGSSTTYGEFERYRQVGAVARDMLVRAAAAKWKVAASKIKVERGVLSNGGKQLRFGEVAEAAMKLAPPMKVALKDQKDWKIIGTPTKRLDTPEKITGAAKYGMDVQFPGLRTALVLRPAAFGSTLVKYDDTAALKIPGVEKVVKTATGVAVIAKHFWAAKLGRDALVVEWSKPEDGGVTTAKQLAEFRTLANRPGAIAGERGKVDDALAAPAKTQREFVYEFPYLAHAPMEPLNCAVKIDGDRVEVWTGTQSQTIDQGVTARIAGTTPDKVTMHTMFLGGGFGRRGNLVSDFVAEAVVVAKAAGVPTKTVWTREDDIRGGYYRPSYVHKLRVAADDSGAPIAWDHVVVGQSIAAGTPFEAYIVQNGVDRTSTEGLFESPYLDNTPALRVSLHSPRTAVPVLFWRSVGNTHTAFAIECTIDELAHAAGKDPLAYRLALLANKPRHAAALKLAAEKAGWGSAPPAGRARGLAVHESFGTIVAECAEVSVERGKIRVHAVTCAVDCGTAVNPLGIEAQMQGAIAFGLSAALYGKIELDNGRVVQSNFHDYPLVRMVDMPRVAVHIINSGAKMGGIGEPAVPPIAPAVGNAVFALTKHRIRTLPMVVPS